MTNGAFQEFLHISMMLFEAHLISTPQIYGGSAYIRTVLSSPSCPFFDFALTIFCSFIVIYFVFELLMDSLLMRHQPQIFLRPIFN